MRLNVLSIHQSDSTLQWWPAYHSIRFVHHTVHTRHLVNPPDPLDPLDPCQLGDYMNYNFKRSYTAVYASTFIEHGSGYVN